MRGKGVTGVLWADSRIERDRPGGRGLGEAVCDGERALGQRDDSRRPGHGHRSANDGTDKAVVNRVRYHPGQSHRGTDGGQGSTWAFPPAAASRMSSITAA